jgi:sirohydrochlorin ferrochelatase
VDIPAALKGSPGRQTGVLGPDPLLLTALERRLAEVGVARGDPGTALVLAAAGSTDAEAVDGVRQLAERWRRTGWRDVLAGFASAVGPTVEEAIGRLRAAGAQRVAVASYLLSPGLFADKVATSGADVTSAPLGDAPEVVTLVLRRYDEAAEDAERQ